MLVITRVSEQEVVVTDSAGEELILKVLDIYRDRERGKFRVKLGFEAPQSIIITPGEDHESGCKKRRSDSDRS